MNSVLILIDTLFNLYLMVVLLRLWLQFARADFYNPFSQFVVKATHPLVGPLRRVLPSIGRLDTATLVLALLVAAVKLVVIRLVVGGIEINPLQITILSVITVLKEALSLLIYVLILRAILSWVSQGRNPIELVMGQLTEPLLAPIRKRMPDLGGLDLSVMVVILFLFFIQNLLGEWFGIY
ncbi:YggT family protein [Paraglaciecola marina]|uniref:YggT family protein n=2 Tax=Paraglaciecola TaxID=1621534 RepID=UPI00105E6FF0|nr:YggT family protein [Paraglaciecola marina]